MNLVCESHGETYPVRDLCNKGCDPSNGCLYTDALYFRQFALIFNGENVISFLNADDTVLTKVGFKSNITYVLDMKELACYYVPSTCPDVCEEHHGSWNAAQQLCHIELYVKEICLRVKPNGDSWKLDDSVDWKLPSNRHFDMYDSDQVGCVYSNNWNSVIYSYTPTSNILLYVLESDVVDM